MERREGFQGFEPEPGEAELRKLLVWGVGDQGLGVPPEPRPSSAAARS